MFVVVHDGARPFSVQAGANEIVDVGTSFDVAHRKGGLEVAVAEGAVVFNPKVEAVRLDAGRMLRSYGHRLTVAAVDRETVGSWREGRIVYEGTPIGDVAADIGRRIGVAITVEPAVSGEVFRGTIDMATLAGRPENLAALLGTGIKRERAGWRLVAPR